MTAPLESYYEKRGKLLVKNLQDRHFDAYYCKNREEALETALSLIPQGATVGWGGAHSAEQIGLMSALKSGDYRVIDRAEYSDPSQAMHECLNTDVFLTGANGLSLDGQMVNIDGTGNRVAAIVYGPESVIVVAGMNKVVATLDDAIVRARTIAAPINQQRLMRNTPCSKTGTCMNCNSVECICNQILITRNCRPAGRIKFILVGEDLGF